ncbi:MAG: dihydrolipoamide acetyltransferase family protein [Chloroflexota bacterium]
MPTVIMPQLGESVEEGTIGKWLKEIGDHVRVGDPLVEVVTDKVNAEVPSPFEGTLTKILVAEGEAVSNDARIAEIEETDATAEAPPEAAAMASNEEAVAVVVAQANAEVTPAPADAARAVATAATAPTAPTAPVPEVVVPAAVSAGNGASVTAATAGNGASVAAVAVPVGVRMTPAVRRLAREKGVDVATLQGSGSGGRVTRADIEGADAGAPAPVVVPPAKPAPAVDATPSPVAEGDSLKRLSPMRKAIAAHMTKFLEVPTAYIMVEVDMTPVVRARTAANADYKAREGMSLSYVAYMTKACVEALKKHHDLNAHWTEEGHWRRKDINIGIAVAVPDGLVVPVIRNAENLSLHGLNVAINDLAKRSRSKKIKPDELRGGTFTVNNTGWTGSVLTLPIINVPEVAIVTMEKIVKRPVVLSGPDGDVIAVRSMMNMAIAIDHRATDGAQAGAFLTDVQAWLEAVDSDTPVW